MATSKVQHSPLDLLPVPANYVFCKACSTIHALRGLLCPAFRLDVCWIHKTVFLPHEKSFYPNSHLEDVDTECPNCLYKGSEKKLNRALSRSNSCALRASLNHQDRVFCVYCWNNATKKCLHLSSCREHSSVYLRSQIDINSKWWLRPSDFACHLCPTNGVMMQKAREWSKDLSSPPAATLFGPDWDEWRGHISAQMDRLKPGAFPSMAARYEYVGWLNSMGKDEMLFLRYLAYEGVPSVTFMYAETGTMPNGLRYQLQIQMPRSDPPPPYVITQTTSETGSNTSTPTTSPSPTTAPLSVPSTVPTANHLARSATLTGPGRLSGNYAQQYRHVHAPRHSQIQSMHMTVPSHQISQMYIPQVRTTHIPQPSHVSQASLNHLNVASGQLSVPVGMQSHANKAASQYALPRGLQLMPLATHVSQPPQNQPYLANLTSVIDQLSLGNPATTYAHHPGTQSQVTHQSHYSFQQPTIQPDQAARRVSFAPQQPVQTTAPPTNSVPLQYYQHSQMPSTAAAPQMPAPSVNPSMAAYLAHLRSSRMPHNPTPSTIPGSYPTGHPADDDWETITEKSEGEVQGPVPPVPTVSQYHGISYQGLPQTNPVYPPFQPAYHQSVPSVPGQFAYVPPMACQ